jgi:hypothetical protein
MRGPSPVTECSSTQTEMSNARIPMPMPSHGQRERGGGAIDNERGHENGICHSTNVKYY